MLVKCHAPVQPVMWSSKRAFDSLEEATDDEEDLLDKAWGLKPTSRLSCQALMADEDVVIEIPKYTINHAKENH